MCRNQSMQHCQQTNQLAFYQHSVVLELSGLLMMYLRAAFSHLKSSIRCQASETLLLRSWSHTDANPSTEDNSRDIAAAVLATDAVRQAQEKAEWNRLSMIEKFSKKFLPSQVNSIVIFAVTGIVYVLYEQWKNDYEIKYNFRHGSCPTFKFREDQLLERTSLLNSLVSIVTPVADKLVSSYYIVVGEHGSGKSSLIRQAARQAGRGVIYVDVPANVDKFGYAFAGAIRFRFKERLRLSTWIETKMFGSPPDEGKEASWERVLITFEKYAALFKKRYGLVPVLILDNCDRLSRGDAKTLEILQDTAKRAIDNSNWVTVFVMAVGNTPEQMEGRSSITRASPFMEISDLSEEESMIYLTEKRSISKDMARDVFDLFGGRIKSLQSAASKLESGIPFSNIRKATLQDIARRIEKLRCRSSAQEEAFLMNVLWGLLDQPELSVSELIEMERDVSIRQKILDELRDETILIRSITNASYAYHSQVIKVCIQEYYHQKHVRGYRRKPIEER